MFDFEYYYHILGYAKFMGEFKQIITNDESISTMMRPCQDFHNYLENKKQNLLFLCETHYAVVGQEYAIWYKNYFKQQAI